MIERVHLFGSHRGLVGVITEPSSAERRPNAPTVVFSNVGLNHRVGPGRVYVDLARELAAAGYVTMRFDLSGFGDSEPRRTDAGDLERAVLDTREALDFLEKKGSSRFVLLGLCSGVDSAHALALADSRVVGAVFIDGYAYRNRGFWLRYYTARMLQAARWKRYFRQRRVRMRRKQANPDTGPGQEVFSREYPPQATFASEIARLVGRAVELLFIYTVVADNHYNYPNQFRDTFGDHARIDVEYYTRADHVFSATRDRTQLISRVVGWMNARFSHPADTVVAASVST
ncbi:MAG: alpha/beta fold hydrolase, partial [Acidobacteriota bacterium]